MKNIKVGELCLLILVGTVAYILCAIITGMMIFHNETAANNEALREKLLSLIDTMVGAVIGVVSTLLSQNKDKEPPKD